MRPLLWLLVPFLLLQSACSTMRPVAPAKVDPPPVLLTMPCLAPGDLKGGATAQDLSLWTIAWMGAYWCERERREGLIGAWPK